MDPRVARIVELVETRIQYGSDEERSGLSVQALAEAAGLSRFRLLHLFKRDTGRTLRDYLQDLQLAKAAVRVRFTRESLLSVALDLGFGSQQAFTRAFTRRWGISPQALRRLPAEAVPCASPDYPVVPSGEPLPARIVRAPARRLWARRYVGPYPQVPLHWQDFAARLTEADLPVAGPCFGMLPDDPLFTPPQRTRYVCAVAAPQAPRMPPPGWHRIDLGASRFVVFSLQDVYLEGHARLRRRLLDWLAESGELLGPSGAFECYRQPPVAGQDRPRHMELHCSLAG